MNQTLSKIIQLINTESFYEAEQELRKIYNQFSNSFDINKLLGAATLAQRKYNIALKCYEKCWNKKKDYDTAVNLSFIFLKTQYYENSINFGNEALAINPAGAHSYQNIATSYFHLAKYEKAGEYALKAIDKRGGMESKNFLATEDLVALYGNILIAQRRNDEFHNFAKKILDLKYIQRILVMLLREDRKLITQKHTQLAYDAIEHAPKIQKRIERNVRYSDAYFFLAEYFNKTDQKKSEEYYVLGNQFISDMQRESIFLRQKYALGIYQYFKNLDSSIFSKSIDPQKGKGLIFVLGMPRSGTTLTESILSTADDLVAGGEKSFFSLQLFEFLNNLANGEDIPFNEEFAKDLGDRYLDHIKPQLGEKSMFVDKLPENYLYVKFIQICLPGARFIHCNRSPWDNAVSLFKQNYSINIFYASSFFGIAAEYANQEFLMKCWKEQDPNNSIISINYEDLVKKEQDTSRSMWEFLGLQGGYNPEKRKDYVGYTASMQQVSKDIYDSSINKDEFLDKKATFFEDLEKQRAFWNKKLN